MLLSEEISVLAQLVSYTKETLMFDFIKLFFTGSKHAATIARPTGGTLIRTPNSADLKSAVEVAKPTGDGGALERAAYYGEVDLVQSLLERGGDVNAKGPEDWTALIAASSTGRHKIVQLLLAKGADVDARTSDGETALIRASALGHSEVVAMLLAAGADVNAGNGKAIKFASQEGHRDVVDMLVDKGAYLELFRIWCKHKADAENYVDAPDGEPTRLMMLLALVSELSEKDKIAVIDSRRQGRYEIRTQFDKGEEGFALVFFK